MEIKAPRKDKYNNKEGEVIYEEMLEKHIADMQDIYITHDSIKVGLYVPIEDDFKENLQILHEDFKLLKSSKNIE